MTSLRIELHNDGQVDIYSNGAFPFATDQLTTGEALYAIAAVLLGVPVPPYARTNNRPLPFRTGGIHTVILCEKYTHPWGHDATSLRVTVGDYEEDGLCGDEALYLITRLLMAPTPGHIIGRRKRVTPLLEGKVQL